MNITFLGTGTSTGIPMLACECGVCKSTDSKDKRMRSSIFVEINQTKFLIDTGPDLRTQLLRENIMDVDCILLTHYHKDHISGLEDIRGISVIREKSIPVYANAETIKVIQRDFYYAFENNKPQGLMNISLHTIENKMFNFKGINIVPIFVKHGNMEVLGFRIHDLTYITDVNFIAEQELTKIKGSELLIISALQKQKHPSHFCLSEVLALTKSLNIKQTYFTHISHKMGLHADVSKELEAHTQLAYDGLKIIL